MTKVLRFLVTLFFGYLGVHKFIDKKYGIGFLYLCTAGLFGIGWLYDSVCSFHSLIKPKNNNIDDYDIDSTNTEVYIINNNDDIQKTDKPTNINSSVPNEFTEACIFNEIRIIQDSIYLIDNSTNFDTIIGRLEFIPEHIFYLKVAEKKGLYTLNPTAGDYYNRYILLKDAIIQDAIIRCYKKVLDGANSLKTEKGRINRINKFFDKLIEYKPLMSTTIQTYIDNFIETRK